MAKQEFNSTIHILGILRMLIISPHNAKEVMSLRDIQTIELHIDSLRAVGRWESLAPGLDCPVNNQLAGIAHECHNPESRKEKRHENNIAQRDIVSFQKQKTILHTNIVYHTYTHEK